RCGLAQGELHCMYGFSQQNSHLTKDGVWCEIWLLKNLKKKTRVTDIFLFFTGNNLRFVK
ncbi:hypothetical protein J8815_21040, partial [Klebsiella pneumoniae]